MRYIILVNCEVLDRSGYRFGVGKWRLLLWLQNVRFWYLYNMITRVLYFEIFFRLNSLVNCAFV